MNLYIIRHGNPDYSKDCLTELGKQQALSCAEFMKTLDIDEIYSSPCGRAVETAEFLANPINLTVNIEPWAHEVEHYADIGGGHFSFAVQMDPTFLRSPEIEKMGDGFISHPRFGSEKEMSRMINEVTEGLDCLLLRLGYKREENRYKIIENNEKNIALYCHAGVFLIIAGHLLGIPQNIAWHSFFMYQTGVAWCNFNNFDSEYTVPRFYYINETNHLREKGIELT